MRNPVLTLAGCVALLLGVVGIFVPLLPTTPLLLLAAACFLRSSDTLYNWLTRHRFLGRYIRCYQQFGAVSRRSKVCALLLLWASISCTALVYVNSPWLQTVLLAVAVGVTIHILRLPTLTPAMVEQLELSSSSPDP